MGRKKGLNVMRPVMFNIQLRKEISDYTMLVVMKMSVFSQLLTLKLQGKILRADIDDVKA